MLKDKESQWTKAMLGPLPNDFLRPTTYSSTKENIDAQTSMALYHQVFPQISAPNHVGRLSITCAQAKLARNYGLTRMDPYVRIRLGHYVYETQTDSNGGKNPRWNRVIKSQLPVGVISIYVEVYDECSFKMDELIAWCEIKIPQSIFAGETHEEWYPLNGKQGEGLEGSIDIVLSFSNQHYIYQAFRPPSQMIMVPPERPMPIFIKPGQSFKQSSEHNVIFEEDLKQIREMFPNIDVEVIKTIHEVNRSNKDATINSLLKMNE